MFELLEYVHHVLNANIKELAVCYIGAFDDFDHFLHFSIKIHFRYPLETLQPQYAFLLAIQKNISQNHQILHLKSPVVLEEKRKLVHRYISLH